VSQTDSLVTYCEALQDDYPRAKRCLAAMRRSGRDVHFNAYIGLRRLRIEVARPAVAVVRWLVTA